MGMYQNIQDILNVLWYDEQLLRLLHYSPEDIRTNTLDPLDPSLPNILDMDEVLQWEIRNATIKLTPKEDDLTDKKSCKLFVYLGERYGSRGNYLFANQNVVFDIITPVDFENGDMRTTRISDRLNDLFALEYVTGIGKMDFVRGMINNRIPSAYVSYRLTYEFTETKR
jgi:hypothetical protein